MVEFGSFTLPERRWRITFNLLPATIEADRSSLYPYVEIHS